MCQTRMSSVPALSPDSARETLVRETRFDGADRDVSGATSQRTRSRLALGPLSDVSENSFGPGGDVGGQLESLRARLVAWRPTAERRLRDLVRPRAAVHEPAPGRLVSDRARCHPDNAPH